MPAVNPGLNAMPQLTTYNALIPTTSYLDVLLEVSIKSKDQRFIALSYPIYMLVIPYLLTIDPNFQQDVLVAVMMDNIAFIRSQPAFWMYIL